MSSVDVIVPCYRYGHFLRECVESVLSQSMVDVRILIIDDASPDNTAEVGSHLAREDSRVTFSRHNVNKGHIATYNEGIEWTSSDYYLLLSADDYLLPGALSRATRLMDSYPDVGFTFGSAIELSDGGVTKEIEAIPKLLRGMAERILGLKEFIEIISERNIVPTPTAVVRTGLQKKVGGYRAELPHTGDMEMWLRLAAHASSVGVIRGPQAVRRHHSANMFLAYTKNSWLPDLQQRRLAIDSFIQSCSHILPKAQVLHRKMLRALGREAAGWASAAFNDGNIELCEEISRFAINCSPSVKISLPWFRLASKRLVGLNQWRIMQPAIMQLRQFAPRRSRN